MMKLNVGDYEINISAKMNYKDRCNKHDTQCFMNLISIAFAEASDNMKNKGCDGLSEDYRKIADELFKTLKEQGLYDK